MKKKKKVEEEEEDEEEEEEEPEPTKKEKKELWQVGEVPTQTAPVIINTKTKEQYDMYLALARILNTLEQLKQLLD